MHSFIHSSLFKRSEKLWIGNFTDQTIEQEHYHHHWAAVVSRGWAKASACRLQVSLKHNYLRLVLQFRYLFPTHIGQRGRAGRENQHAKYFKHLYIHTKVRNAYPGLMSIVLAFLVVFISRTLFVFQRTLFAEDFGTF